MDDKTLVARFDTLIRNLNLVRFQLDEASSNRECFLNKYVELCKQPAWKETVGLALAGTLGIETKDLIKDVVEKKTELLNTTQDDQKTLKEVWEKYREYQDKGQEIFRDWVEVIGGLALRDKGFDERICKVADKLVRRLADSCRLSWSPTIPSAQEAVGKTIARIIRMRFHEWTIWSLPLTAHEFGHVLVADNDSLKNFSKDNVDKLKSKYLEILQKNEDPAKYANKDPAESYALKNAERRLNEFLADAFATYTMGPAYLCFAILFQLNPWPPKDCLPAEDSERAYIIISVLNRMDKEAHGAYNIIIKDRRTEWDRIAEANGVYKLSDTQYLDDIVSKICMIFSTKFINPVKYPATGINDGWLKAQDWSGRWEEELKNSLGKLGDPDKSWISDASRLRDVLNAAWLCRIHEPDYIKEIESAAVKLCDLIIEQSP